jgi:hypothetical protein
VRTALASLLILASIPAPGFARGPEIPDLVMPASCRAIRGMPELFEELRKEHRRAAKLEKNAEATQAEFEKIYASGQSAARVQTVIWTVSATTLLTAGLAASAVRATSFLVARFAASTGEVAGLGSRIVTSLADGLTVHAPRLSSLLNGKVSLTSLVSSILTASGAAGVITSQLSFDYQKSGGIGKERLEDESPSTRLAASRAFAKAETEGPNQSRTQLASYVAAFQDMERDVQTHYTPLIASADRDSDRLTRILVRQYDGTRVAGLMLDQYTDIHAVRTLRRRALKGLADELEVKCNDAEALANLSQEHPAVSNRRSNPRGSAGLSADEAAQRGSVAGAAR